MDFLTPSRPRLHRTSPSAETDSLCMTCAPNCQNSQAAPDHAGVSADSPLARSLAKSGSIPFGQPVIGRINGRPPFATFNDERRYALVFPPKRSRRHGPGASAGASRPIAARGWTAASPPIRCLRTIAWLRQPSIPSDPSWPRAPAAASAALFHLGNIAPRRKRTLLGVPFPER
ncbi:hypothetical protein F8B43_1152 [Methylorubrum populi]|uniref:Uncharacterized protein n=1 Tax=Methylorubrum populi TaxID=223967 RepID=A0A833MZT6_9HYPH|nr:hypothetical protein F8B43_1152 [Methylorubrum populi]